MQNFPSKFQKPKEHGIFLLDTEIVLFTKYYSLATHVNPENKVSSDSKMYLPACDTCLLHPSELQNNNKKKKKFLRSCV